MTYFDKKQLELNFEPKIHIKSAGGYWFAYRGYALVATGNTPKEAYDNAILIEKASKLSGWFINTGIRCLWDSLPEYERNQPMGLSCNCPKCSPWSINNV